MSEQLKPCPFCGSECCYDFSWEINYCWYRCESCGAMGPEALYQEGESAENEVSAAAQWNRRAENLNTRKGGGD